MPRCLDNLTIRSRRCQWLWTLFLGRLSAAPLRHLGFHRRIPQACRTDALNCRTLMPAETSTPAPAVGRSSMQWRVSMKTDLLNNNPESKGQSLGAGRQEGSSKKYAVNKCSYAK